MKKTGIIILFLLTFTGLKAQTGMDQIFISPGASTGDGAQGIIGYVNVMEEKTNIRSAIHDKSYPNSVHLVNFYPNPASNGITLERSGQAFPNPLSVTIMDAKGVTTLVQANIIEQKQFIDLKNLASGTYIMIVFDKECKDQEVLKLIKQ